MKSIAQELAPRRIRVNAIGPGAVRTPINTAIWRTVEAYRDLMTLVPYKRIGEPEDIARAAVWLVSDDYITGTTLFVDVLDLPPAAKLWRRSGAHGRHAC